MLFKLSNAIRINLKDICSIEVKESGNPDVKLCLVKLAGGNMLNIAVGELEGTDITKCELEAFLDFVDME